MTYYIVEIQTTGDTPAYLVSTRNDRNAAESEYHRVLSAAAVSSIEKHACVLFTEEGFPLMHYCYQHQPVAEE